MQLVSINETIFLHHNDIRFSSVSGFVSSRTWDVTVYHKSIPFKVTQPTHVLNPTRASPVYIGRVSVSTYAKASRKKCWPEEVFVLQAQGCSMLQILIFNVDSPIIL